MSTAKTIAKDKTFAASLAVVTVALLASQGVELEEGPVQILVESLLAASAAVGIFVATFRAAFIKVRADKS